MQIFSYNIQARIHTGFHRFQNIKRINKSIYIVYIFAYILTTLVKKVSFDQRKWERGDPSTVPATVAATQLKEIDSGMYPNITECFKFFSTLPVTTCECERNVSALRRLKTYLRSTMSQTRLTGLALLHIHYNMDIDFNEIIRRFARLHPRRMQLANQEGGSVSRVNIGRLITTSVTSRHTSMFFKMAGNFLVLYFCKR